MIETAIVLPLYMILLFGLLFFGYATLGRQRQDKATAYAARQSAPQQAGPLVTQFWAWNGAISPGNVNPALPNASAAIAGDTTFSVYGGSANGQWVRPSDEYYGMAINGTVFVPCQLVAGIHSISGGGGDFFDTERVSVDLWNFAFGATTQSFNWTPGQGLVQQFNTSYTSFAWYLNKAANPAGLLFADDGHPPTPDLASNEPWPQGWGGRLAGAFNGPPGGGQWLQRRAVESQMTYQPPFLRYAYAAPNAPPSTFGRYVTGNYAPPTLPPATMDCDVTIRNSASARQGAEEAPQTADALLTEVAGFLSQPTLAGPDSLDGQQLNSSGTTMQAAWTPW